MKRIQSAFVFLALVALTAPASALSVTNLDVVPHTLVLSEVFGSKLTRTVAPNENIHISSARGQAFLQDKPEQLLQVEHLDRLVIWPQGNLMIQMRRKGHGRGD